MRRLRIGMGAALLMLGGAAVPAIAGPARVPLADGWKIQSSAKMELRGPALSRAGADTKNWHTAVVPSTVVGALVAEGQFRDPYTAMNLRAIPGTSYPIGSVFSRGPMPLDSPYRVSWWYRKEFDAAPDAA